MSPDTRRHRGPHPADRKLFSPQRLPTLRRATRELSWLLERGYAAPGALKLVGDRHQLAGRQRLAVARAACGRTQRARRLARCLPLARLRGKPLLIDGFNLIITVEAALSGGVLVRCRDGCVRDLASVHGSYRSVHETERALRVIGEALEALGPVTVRWLLDRPVSNSGRLARQIEETARARGWPWETAVVPSPDGVLVRSPRVVITSDGTVLDRVARWVNLAEALLRRHCPQAWVIDLSGQ